MKWYTRLSICLNKLIGGKKDYTLCAQLYANFLVQRRWWHRPLIRTINVISGDKRHCLDAWIAAWQRAGSR